MAGAGHRCDTGRKLNRLRLLLLLIAFLCAAPVSAQGYRVIATYPHDRSAFTEGLFYQDGSLYESTGREGQSDIREVRLKDGKVLRRVTLPPQYFGEGIVPWKDEILSLTWQHGVGFRWRRDDFTLAGSFRYKGEGWGMTQDGRSEEHTSELQSLMRISYAVFVLKKKCMRSTDVTNLIYSSKRKYTKPHGLNTTN